MITSLQTALAALLALPSACPGQSNSADLQGAHARSTGDLEGAPYPPSTVIKEVVWDFESYRREAPGSDNWPITWADDGHQYTVWGDGGGFGGGNSPCRSSLGVARVEGDADDYVGYNVWGCNEESLLCRGDVEPQCAAEWPVTLEGKSYGIVSVEGTLYAWWGPGSGDRFLDETRVMVSTDHSQTWTLSEWRFTRAQELYAGTFLNFGQDYAGARDAYVYSYFPRGSSGFVIHKPGFVDLARVPKNEIMNQEEYEFFAGSDKNGDPTWTSDVLERVAVFEDPNGVRTASVGYNAPLGRYLLTTEHTEARQSNLAVFDAPEPWGPWTTVAYYTGWGGFQGHLSFYFPSKWIGVDGRDFTLLFSDPDSWTTVDGTFVLWPRCAADLNDDNAVDFDDLLAVLDNWGPVEPCPPFAAEDIDQDCEVGLGDVLVVLAAWGPCRPIVTPRRRKSRAAAAADAIDVYERDHHDRSSADHAWLN